MREPSENRRETPDRIVAWLSHSGVEHAVLHEYAANQVLCEPSDAPRFVFYLQSGQVRIHHFSMDNTERFSAILGDGAWIGLAGLAGRPAYSIRARVFGNAFVWQMPTAALLEALAKTPNVAASVVTQLAERLFESYEAASRLVFYDCDRRLVQTLLDFSRSPAAVAQADDIILQITHQELAQAVGAARETVSLALNELRGRNLIRTARNRIAFNQRALKEFAQSQARAHPVQP